MITDTQLRIAEAEKAAAIVAQQANIVQQANQLTALKEQAAREQRAAFVAQHMAQLQPVIAQETATLLDEAEAIRTEYDALLVAASQLAAKLKPYREHLYALEQRVSHLPELEQAGIPYQELEGALQTLAHQWGVVTSSGALNTIPDQVVHSHTLTVGMAVLKLSGLSAMPKYKR